VPLDAGTLEGYDAVIVTTDHTAVDYGLVAAASKRVFDTRNAFDGRGIAIDRARLIKI
jgi:UDP-N-acetyl-D-glucosamine dehydrogenase